MLCSIKGRPKMWMGNPKPSSMFEPFKRGQTLSDYLTFCRRIRHGVISWNRRFFLKFGHPSVFMSLHKSHSEGNLWKLKTLRLFMCFEADIKLHIWDRLHGHQWETQWRGWGSFFDCMFCFGWDFLISIKRTLMLLTPDLIPPMHITNIIL